MPPSSPSSVTAGIAISRRGSSLQNRRSVKIKLVLLTGLLLMLHALSGMGIDTITLRSKNLSGDNWSISDIALSTQLASDQDSFLLSIGQLEHPALASEVHSIQLNCQRGTVTATGVSCRQGLLDFHYQSLGQTGVPVTFNWNKVSQDIELELKNIKVSGGRFTVSGAGNLDRWQAQIRGQGIRLGRLASVLPALAAMNSTLQLSGRSALDLRLSGDAGGRLTASWRADVAGMTFSDTSQRYLGEGVAGRWVGQLSNENRQRNWSGAQEFTLKAGAILTPDFYLAPGAVPIRLKGQLTAGKAGDWITLSRLDYTHPEVLSFSGSLGARVAPEIELTRLQIETEPAELKALYSNYLEPVLVSPLLEGLELSGRMQTRLELEPGGQWQLAAQLQQVYLEQGLVDGAASSGSLALYGVNGTIHWREGAGGVETSELSWQGGHLFGTLDLGESRVRFRLQDRTLALTEPATLAVLDGSLQAEVFELKHDKTGPNVRFQGYLTPISMEVFSQAMGWPVMSGQLSGMIPGVTYHSGSIKVEGIALVKLFGGTLLIKNLLLDDLIGVLPALSADIELKNLDLERLTRTFSFGRITGKLGGRIDRLRLEDWQPVAFDARFATPDDDDSRHRISQKAVDNISNLGGAGVSGAISRSFLRFFEEFSYNKLGISCRLEAGVCHMGGVEEAQRGYYLVKGGGIPRIDIMGFNRRTDWSVLTAKLNQIIEGGTPVIE